ncbi:hypothetical protein ACFX2B_008304 [Malus domestica]
MSKSHAATSDQSSHQGSNTYVAPSPTLSQSLSFKDSVETVRNVFGRWRKSVGEPTKKAEDLAGNTWQLLKTSPSFADAAMGRIALGTKLLAEGGYEKIFRSTFKTTPEEQLQNSFACYLSTSVQSWEFYMFLLQSLRIAVIIPFRTKLRAKSSSWSSVSLHNLQLHHHHSPENNAVMGYLQQPTWTKGITFRIC